MTLHGDPSVWLEFGDQFPGLRLRGASMVAGDMETVLAALRAPDAQAPS